MFQHRCPNCGCAAEEAAAQLPFHVQMRLLRTGRVIAVSTVLLLLMVLAILVLLMFGTPAGLRHRNKEPESQHNLPEARSEKLQSDQDFSHPSALLTIVNETRPSFLEWRSDLGNGYNKGMIISEENVIVPTNGMYRLYLQVTFDFFSHESSVKEEICEDDLMSLEISVQRLNNRYMHFRTLLVSKDTMSCSHGWTKSMSTTGTFKLEANSLLRVQLLHKELVYNQDTHTFFGVELVSQ
ncbi:tumor necrosis factor ligand superfamily member 15 [Eucyclogobius newberryi]|uniref:tumor necrosis factor ligand superfamily member 15 n=1 Tax=Eucyclogobius newberryi TaxID=166745 RepID=UPI003B5CEB0C